MGTIVILGAGWVGLPLAHKLLKHTLPKAKDGLKVILVSPNSHFYWNVAAVRGVIPGAIPDEQLFLPIEPGFVKYPNESFEFILGKAETVDPEKNTIGVARNDGTQQIVSYDQLVVATGSQMRGNLPFKSIGTYEDTLAAFHKLQRQVSAAKSIIIAGAGSTGVETAGELAASYGKKKDFTLVIKGEHTLQASHASHSVSRTVEKDLEKLGVKLIRNAQVDEVRSSKDKEGDEVEEVEKTQIILSNGSTLVCDLYLPLFGCQVNTSFLPTRMLNSAGDVVLDPKTMRIEGTSNIWGIGDVGNLEAKQITATDAQIIHLAQALDSVLFGEDRKIREFKPTTKTMIFITMGKKHAIGQIGSWRLWGWTVSYVKGRFLFVETAREYVGGKRLRHASM
ncbi:hypothetical protein MMC25_004456 [Agyrium rufum]|nr:hypothetical protein [Agyrium rufum]